MPVRSRAGRLCSRCRYDLLLFFENGFCDWKPLAQTRRPFATIRPRSGLQRRGLPFAARASQHGSPQATDNAAGRSNGAVSEEAEFTEDQLAARRAIQDGDNADEIHEPRDAETEEAKRERQRAYFAEMEEKFEQSSHEIDPANMEDFKQLRALLAEAKMNFDKGVKFDGDDALEEAAEGGYELDHYDEGDPVPASQPEPADESVSTLRDKGASPMEVAREARQIHGEHLPEGVLQDSESKVYRRLYGEPLADIELDAEENIEPEVEDASRGELVDGSGRPIPAQAKVLEASERPKQEPALTFGSTFEDRASSVALALEAEYAEDGIDHDDDMPIHPLDRAHPMTALGKAGTRPSTISLPRSQYADPLHDILAEYSNKQLKETSERTFGGPGLPDSPLTPRSGRTRKQIPIPLQASQIFMGEMEANAFVTSIMPPAYAAITSVLAETRKRLGQTWLTELLGKEGGPRILDAGAGGAGVLAWNEVIRAHWDSLHSSDANPPRPPPSKTVVLTGSDPLRNRSAALLENTTFIPRLPDYVHARNKPTMDDDRSTQRRKQFDVIISSYSLLPFKEDWEKKQYVQNLWSLLSPTGGVLILIEKGMPRGFEAIAGARDLLLERYIATPSGHRTHYTTKHQDDEDSVHRSVRSMIVAPCTNHEKCPMYRVPGESRGRKDWCSFQQRYIRPPQLQRILGARDRNHDDVDFSYISVMKGHDLREHIFSNWNHLSDPLSSTMSTSGAQGQMQRNTETWMQECTTGFATTTPESITNISTPGTGLAPTHSLPRLVYPPIKRQGHILLDVCTPAGTLERWTVPRSFSKQAFRDARKAQWGDIWALGAKTRVPRKIRMGADSKENKTASSRDERQRKKALESLDRRKEEKEAQRMEEEEMDREVEEWEEGMDGGGEDDEDDLDDDILNRVWQDIGVDHVEQQGKPPKIEMDGGQPLRRSSAAPPSSAADNTNNQDVQSSEDAATRQVLAEWEQEFEMKRIGRNMKDRAGRATKDSTRRTKRKYREMKRNGDLEPERERS